VDMTCILRTAATYNTEEHVRRTIIAKCRATNTDYLKASLDPKQLITSVMPY
jgi:hypothetical protein